MANQGRRAGYNFGANNGAFVGGVPVAPQYNNNQSRFNRGDYQGAQLAPKHSGAKIIVKGDDSFISAWNYSKSRGMVSVFIAKYSGTKTVTTPEGKGQAGRKSTLLMCKVFYKNTGVELHFPVLMDIATSKVVIPTLGWVVNPKAARGGYCGTFTNKG